VRGLEVDRGNPKVTLNWDADMWELYTASMDCSEAAKALNEAFVNAVNAGKTRREVEAAVNEVQMKYREYGANDSEPFWHLEALLDAVFKEN